MLLITYGQQLKILQIGLVLDLLNIYTAQTGANIGFFTEGDASNTKLMILGNGDVGIGTDSPDAKLSVSNSGAEGYEISPATVIGGVVRQLAFNRSTSAYIPMRTQASEHQFYSGATQKMLIDSSGVTLASGFANLPCRNRSRPIFNIWRR